MSESIVFSLTLMEPIGKKEKSPPRTDFTSLKSIIYSDLEAKQLLSRVKALQVQKEVDDGWNVFLFIVMVLC